MTQENGQEKKQIDNAQMSVDSMLNAIATMQGAVRLGIESIEQRIAVLVNEINTLRQVNAELTKKVQDTQVNEE